MLMTEPVGLPTEHSALGCFFHPISPVNGHDNDNRQIVAHSGFEFLKVKAKSAVTGYTINQFVRTGEFGADGIGQAGAEMALVH